MKSILNLNSNSLNSREIKSEFVKLKCFQVCGLKILKIDKLTLKLKLMIEKHVLKKIKIVDNSYSDEEEKKVNINN